MDGKITPHPYEGRATPSRHPPPARCHHRNVGDVRGTPVIEGGAELPALAPVDVAPGYRSPYTVRWTRPADERLSGFDQPPWNDPREQAVIPFAQWSSPATQARWGTWGPRARRYPAPAVRLRGRAARERLLTVAAALLGTDYQHHHVPAWSPPDGWPQKPVHSGLRGPGLDCSNYVGFVYSYALGYDLPTGVVAQSELHRSTSEGALLSHRVGVVPCPTDPAGAGWDPAAHQAFVAALEPGDVLYLRNTSGIVSHAVLWLGDCGVGPTDLPLVIDCGGGNIVDARRTPIPAGVRIRPYRPVGWYARNTAWAHRIVPD
ncbi:NlpC/P60 family protein [Nakamurella flava]|uniref:NlpC/P60 family protein n=1 Tax=Nakamurella flava TaxID=2576308 RepID=A0A4U6QC64_9ACTN|nr:NlpC/P60 family protein [Nakamurella flava]